MEKKEVELFITKDFDLWLCPKHFLKLRNLQENGVLF